MSRVTVKQVIKAPVDRVWETLRSFGNIEDFIPVVTKTVLEGSGIGMKRSCTMINGTVIVERLESLDDAKHTLAYVVLETQAPIMDYVADIGVRDAGDGMTEVEWSSDFTTPEQAREAMERNISALYTMSIKGLETLCG